MVERVRQAVDGRAGDCLSVIVPNATVLGIVNAVSLKTWAELGLIGVTILYTIWRWRRDSFVMCEGCRNGHPPPKCPLPARKRPAWCPRND